jgi:hypothetical protein
MMTKMDLQLQAPSAQFITNNYNLFSFYLGQVQKVSTHSVLVHIFSHKLCISASGTSNFYKHVHATEMRCDQHSFRINLSLYCIWQLFHTIPFKVVLLQPNKRAQTFYYR